VRLLLAPMEGLLDEVLRGVLTRVPAYDCAVTEFVRVSGSLLPDRFFRRIAPELGAGSKTAAGTPVRVQLLGSDPDYLAINALRLSRLGPAAIDLNFGCPAPTVNRHRGGAVLLDEPELLYRIACSVRQALPPELALTAKMRLGVNDTGKALDCARALAGGGVAELVVHARTKADGYRPPAHWEWIGRIADVVAVPVCANGEVWTVADWARCRAVSGVEDVMLGRGAVADPFLAARIRRGEQDDPDPATRAEEWGQLLDLLVEFHQHVNAKLDGRHAAGRLKQWLNFLRRTYPQAEALYQALRPLKTMAEIDPMLREHGVALVLPRAAA